MTAKTQMIRWLKRRNRWSRV